MAERIGCCGADNPYLKARVALSVGNSVVTNELEAALKDADLPQLAWFDVLNKIFLAGDLGMKSVELQAKLLVPQYSLSRLLSKIEEAGLIEKTECPDDARCQELRLTEAGQEMRKKMTPVYSRALGQVMQNRFTADQLQQLGSFYDSFQCPQSDG